MPTPPTVPTVAGVPLPTPTTDHNGLAASVAGILGTLAVLGVLTDVVAAKWTTAALAIIATAGPLWARFKAWPPAKVWLAAVNARWDGWEQGHAAGVERGTAQVTAQLGELAAVEPAPPASPPRRARKAAAKKAKPSSS